MRPDAVARKTQRVEVRSAASGDGGAHLLRRDPNAGLAKINGVELLRQFDDGGVTARPDIGDDRANGRVDIGRRLALGAEEGLKGRFEVGTAGIEMVGHADLWLRTV